jgi:hypothetical protein
VLEDHEAPPLTLGRSAPSVPASVAARLALSGGDGFEAKSEVAAHRKLARSSLVDHGPSSSGGLLDDRCALQLFWLLREEDVGHAGGFAIAVVAGRSWALLEGCSPEVAARCRGRAGGGPRERPKMAVQGLNDRTADPLRSIVRMVGLQEIRLGADGGTRTPNPLFTSCPARISASFTQSRKVLRCNGYRAGMAARIPVSIAPSRTL